MGMDDKKPYLPSNWADDVRMNALFAEFRNRNVNPYDWDAKMNFWKQSITDYAVKSDKVTFRVDQLRDAFNRNGKTPRCLNVVLAEMVKQRQLMTWQDFLSYTSEPGWINWSWDIFVKKPLSWSWSMITSMLYQAPAAGDDHTRYVNMPLLQDKAAAVLRIHQNLVENDDEDWTISFEALFKHCREICKSEKELEMCLLVLKKDKMCSLSLEQQQKIIRFAKNGQNHSTQLTQTDKALIQLRKIKQTLEQQVNLHEAEIKKCLNEAKYYKKLGQNTLAKTSLQKKRQAEKLLEQKERSLDNVEVLLRQLKDSDTQKAVLNALQAGSSAFKAGTMDLDRVDDTMAALRETLEDQEEIEATMASAIGPQMDVSELEQELADLLAEGDVTTPAQTSTPKQQQEDDYLLRRLSKLREPNFPGLPTDLPEVPQTSKPRTILN